MRESGRPAALSKISDFKAEGSVFVGTVRSPSSRGRIASINMPHLPRDYRSITADDIPGKRVMDATDRPMPILASDELSYLGEPIALIAGPDKHKVMEAVRLTRVMVDEAEPDYSFETFDSSRIVASTARLRGRPDEAAAGAATTVSGEYRLGAQDHYYPEPQGAAAQFDYDKLVVYTSTQWPFHVRDSVAAALGVAPGEVIARPTLLGPHLDGKLWYPSLLSCHAALAAMLCKRPALLMLTRREDFLYTLKRAPMMASYEAAMDEEGRLRCMDVSVAMNLGAYSPLARELVARTAACALGPYACPNARVRVWAVRTNLMPLGSFAGMSTSSMAFASERFAEDCATACDIDPSEWRSRNAAGKGDDLGGSPLKRPVPYPALAERLLAASDYPRKRSSFELIRKRRPDPGKTPGYGIGLAFGGQLMGGFLSDDLSDSSSVELTLSKDSALTIRASLAPSVSYAIDTWRRMAADILGLKLRDVSFAPVSTDAVPDSGPSTLSRSIGSVSRLIAAACEGLQAKRFREPLPITIRKTQRRRSAKAAPESPYEGASWGGAVVEVRLDPFDGSPEVRGVWLAVKAGRLLSAERARMALERDAASALGMCLGERLDLSRGPLSAADMRDYRLSRLKDAPPIHVDFMDDDAEPRGLGELAFDLVPPAFANALSQALDDSCRSLPVGDVASRPGDRP